MKINSQPPPHSSLLSQGSPKKFDYSHNFARCLVENVGHGQRLWNCVKSQIFEGYPGAGGTNGEGVENLFSYISILPMLWPNLNSPGDLWKKLDSVKDCVIVWIVKFLRATQGWEGQMEKGLWIFFDRAQPYLCCGQIWTRQMSCGKSWTGSKIV